MNVLGLTNHKRSTIVRWYLADGEIGVHHLLRLALLDVTFLGCGSQNAMLYFTAISVQCMLMHQTPHRHLEGCKGDSRL
jgi:hypothetical protein